MKKTLTRLILKLLKQHNIMSFATVRGGGFPQAAENVQPPGSAACGVLSAANLVMPRIDRRDPKPSLPLGVTNPQPTREMVHCNIANETNGKDDCDLLPTEANPWP